MKYKYVFFVTIYNYALNKLIESPLTYNDDYRNCLSEPLWFYSLYLSLLGLGYSSTNIVIDEGVNCLEDIIKRVGVNTSDVKNILFFMDFQTIPSNCSFINRFKIKNNVYDLNYWGSNCKERFKISGFPLTHVLTPWNYNDYNTFLGFNCDLLFPKDNNAKLLYENYGVILLKSKLPLEETVFKDEKNQRILEKLNSLNIKMYACSSVDIPYDNIINLGLLTRDKWLNLIKSCKFYMAFGCSPRLGTSLLEIHYYNVPIIAPIDTVSGTNIEKSTNYYNTNNLSSEQIAALCNGISWKNDDNYLSEHCDYSYSRRLLSMGI